LLTSVVAFCRAGFESEAARDLERVGSHARATVAPDVVPGAGFVVARTRDDHAGWLARWSFAMIAAEPVFPRSVFFGTGPHRLDVARGRGRADRITPLVAAVESLRDAAPFASVWLEYPDTNEGKALSPLARSLQARFAVALREAGLLDVTARRRPRLHVMLEDGDTALVGASDPERASPWPMGIPRLRVPPGAPSRSTLKLAEAFQTFLGDDDRALRPGQRAVDLGAAPGGWTWQLVQRGLRVTAIDNGALKGEVARDALVTHLRADGLRYRPRRPVDWVTCDIVESPARIAQLMGDWIGGGHARRAIFNLKLPMKKRYDEVERCRDIIARTLERSQHDATLRLRQLYHDREEVTGYLARVD
jgi:23S rRNA (cytidine2498-2'-O)-methyltransferase